MTFQYLQEHICQLLWVAAQIAKASADMTLLGDRLDRILRLDSCTANQKNYLPKLAWSLGYNLLILPLAVFMRRSLCPIGMSASSIIVVSNH